MVAYREKMAYSDNIMVAYSDKKCDCESWMIKRSGIQDTKKANSTVNFFLLAGPSQDVFLLPHIP